MLLNLLFFWFIMVDVKNQTVYSGKKKIILLASLTTWLILFWSLASLGCFKLIELING